jgi:hypothetical protein
MNLLYAFFLMNNEHWIKLMYFIKMARKGFWISDRNALSLGDEA